ncbi:hypothetical protein GCM10011511_44430 [Puia dinghuensis]|uniref:Uncharacterized protein n=1 Tax=Puia dinghuensis TaxID=1792502 RepID=A0A8J2XVH6_9BACT|nr:hypothetical protein GCM10011511_44430 [Puia dinghuensis]
MGDEGWGRKASMGWHFDLCGWRMPGKGCNSVEWGLRWERTGVVRGDWGLMWGWSGGSFGAVWLRGRGWAGFLQEDVEIAYKKIRRWAEGPSSDTLRKIKCQSLNQIYQTV